MSNLKDILPELFTPEIKAEYVDKDNAIIVTQIKDEIDKLHKQKLCEVLTLHYVLQEYGDFL